MTENRTSEQQSTPLVAASGMYWNRRGKSGSCEQYDTPQSAMSVDHSAVDDCEVSLCRFTPNSDADQCLTVSDRIFALLLCARSGAVTEMYRMAQNKLDYLLLFSKLCISTIKHVISMIMYV